MSGRNRNGAHSERLATVPGTGCRMTATVRYHIEFTKMMASCSSHTLTRTTNDLLTGDTGTTAKFTVKPKQILGRLGRLHKFDGVDYGQKRMCQLACLID